MKSFLSQAFKALTLTIFFSLLSSCSKQSNISEKENTKELEIKNTVQYANLILEDDNFEEAISILEDAAKENPKNTDLIESLAFAHANHTNYAEAALYFTELARLDHSQQSTLLFAAQAHIQDNNLLAASNILNEYLGYFPQDSLSWKKLAQIYIDLKNPHNAIQAYINAASNPDASLSGSEALQIANLFSEVNDLKHAEDWYQIALGHEPLIREQALTNLINLYNNSQDTQQTSHYLSLLQNEFPNTFNTPAFQALTTSLKQSPKPTLQTTHKTPQPATKPLPPQPDFDPSLHITQADSKNPQAWYNHSTLCLNNNQLNHAYTSIQEAITLDPSNQTFAIQHISIINKLLDPNSLIPELHKIHSQFPENPDITLSLANAYEKTTPRNAQLLYKQFLTIAPPNHPDRKNVEIKLDKIL